MVPAHKMQNFVDSLPESTCALEIQTPVGLLFLAASPQGLHAVFFDPYKKDRKHKKILSGIPQKETPLLKRVRKQFREYFAGQRKSFDIPLAPSGTPFQQLAWQQLRKIPYGTTVSYQEQALKMKKPKATRAVGSANGRNPLSIIVPCHRVVAKNGGLGGFAGGLKTKKFLLDLEANH